MRSRVRRVKRKKKTNKKTRSEKDDKKYHPIRDNSRRVDVARGICLQLRRWNESRPDAPTPTQLRTIRISHSGPTETRRD